MSAARGQKLEWSAQEQALLEQLGAALDRRSELQALWEQVEGVKTKLRLSAEMRLLEQSAARLLRDIKTDVPQPESRRTVKARKAARVRWDRDAAGQ